MSKRSSQRWGARTLSSLTTTPACGGGIYNDRGTLILSARNVVNPINSKIEDPWTMGAFGSNHPGGAQFGSCDGSVRFVAETIDPNIYKALASRDGTEPTSKKRGAATAAMDVRTACNW